MSTKVIVVLGATNSPSGELGTTAKERLNACVELFDKEDLIEKNSSKLCVGVSHLPLLWRGQNCFFAVLGEVEYKISVFDIHVKMKPAKYPYGFASGIVGFKKFFIFMYRRLGESF